MRAFVEIFVRQPPESYADFVAAHGRGDSPARLKRENWVLAGLFALCFAPRAALACSLDTICDDGYYYLSVADAWSQGRFAEAFHYLNLNVYPAVLALLHALGIEWVLASKLWGVLVGSLTVLPLFGWARRMFDNQIALVSCLLYAFHPKLIELCVEPLRETTFWMSMTLFIYLTCRAVAENKLRYFVGSGVVLTFAVHTRSEGWLLGGLALAWVCVRAWRMPAGRLRLAGGFLAGLAMLPLLLMIVNLTVLRGMNTWQWGRLEHFETVVSWLRDDRSERVAPLTYTLATTSTANKPVAGNNASGDLRLPVYEAATDAAQALAADVAPIVQASVAADAETSSTPLGAIRTYFRDLQNTLDPVFLILITAGLIAARKSIWVWDKLMLWTLALAILLGIWIRLMQIGNMNGRYFLNLLFVLFPYAAIGFLEVPRLLRLSGERLARRPIAQWRVSLVCVAAFVIAGTCSAMLSEHPSRDAQIALGKWLRNELGDSDRVLTDIPSARVGYVLKGSLPTLRFARQPLDAMLTEYDPQVVIFTAQELAVWRPAVQQSVIKQLAGRGLYPVKLPEPSRLHKNYLVFARARQAETDDGRRI